MIPQKPETDTSPRMSPRKNGFKFWKRLTPPKRTMTAFKIQAISAENQIWLVS